MSDGSLVVWQHYNVFACDILSSVRWNDVVVHVKAEDAAGCQWASVGWWRGRVEGRGGGGRGGTRASTTPLTVSILFYLFP